MITYGFYTPARVDAVFCMKSYCIVNDECESEYNLWNSAMWMNIIDNGMILCTN